MWLLVAVLIGFIAFVLYRNDKISIKPFISIPVFAFYLSFVATITIIARIPSHNAQYRLMLFWSYRAIAGGKTDLISEVFWNFVLFIPIGILLMLIISCKHKWIISIAIGLLLSASIEIIQLKFHRGLFEFDDIFHNTLGTVIGIGMFLFISAARKKIR